MACPCRYDEHRVPATREEILEAAGLRNRLDDPEAWLASATNVWA